MSHEAILRLFALARVATDSCLLLVLVENW